MTEDQWWLRFRELQSHTSDPLPFHLAEFFNTQRALHRIDLLKEERAAALASLKHDHRRDASEDLWDQHVSSLLSLHPSIEAQQWLEAQWRQLSSLPSNRALQIRSLREWTDTEIQSRSL